MAHVEVVSEPIIHLADLETYQEDIEGHLVASNTQLYISRPYYIVAVTDQVTQNINLHFVSRLDKPTPFYYRVTSTDFHIYI